MNYTEKDIAKMIDHSLLHPTMNDEVLEAGCALAKQYDVASVCIKPYAVKKAAEWLKGSDVLVGTVIGFPHGSNLTAIKVAETKQAIADGAVEIDMVVNIGKVLSEDYDFVKADIKAVFDACQAGGAILKVIFENDHLPEDKYKIRLCEICNEIGVDFVKTSTGYGFFKQENGSYTYNGATEHDLKLMRKHCNPEIQVKAAGGVRTLEDTLKVRELGVTRIGATATEAIINKIRGKATESEAPAGY
ncbi:deoxyribose-phosphate aldolase [Phaeodactylibacter xiamenensis]|uniref:deoxyribose-phosphate aldolase n=1 Tax=Phaeodactylibacter xiamenensis TaxID=1524460 RepID=UPI0024A98C4C|nr:deoxyribose-phosphate aldolase [Phaeodactylibacter xiamenensis]